MAFLGIFFSFLEHKQNEAGASFGSALRSAKSGCEQRLSHSNV
jgi:hypothetical protein